MDEKDKKEKEKKKKKQEQERPVTVNITNNNQFQKGVGAFITNLNHLTIIMDSEGNMKMDASQIGAMPHTKVDMEQTPEDQDAEEEPPSAAEMAAACEKTKDEGLWWGDASWSVVFRVYCIKGYKGSMKSFIDEVQKWDFKQPFKYKCNKDSVGKPLQRGKITGPIDKWASDGAMAREVKLGERLIAILP